MTMQITDEQVRAIVAKSILESLGVRDTLAGLLICEELASLTGSGDDG